MSIRAEQIQVELQNLRNYTLSDSGAVVGSIWEEGTWSTEIVAWSGAFGSYDGFGDDFNRECGSLSSECESHCEMCLRR